MKKIITLALAIVFVLLMAAPALAETPSAAGCQNGVENARSAYEAHAGGNLIWPGPECPIGYP